MREHDEVLNELNHRLAAEGLSPLDDRLTKAISITLGVYVGWFLEQVQELRRQGGADKADILLRKIESIGDEDDLERRPEPVTRPRQEARPVSKPDQISSQRQSTEVVKFPKKHRADYSKTHPGLKPVWGHPQTWGGDRRDNEDNGE